jgi:hypothetical protein
MKPGERPGAHARRAYLAAGIRSRPQGRKADGIGTESQAGEVAGLNANLLAKELRQLHDLKE